MSSIKEGAGTNTDAIELLCAVAAEEERGFFLLAERGRAEHRGFTASLRHAKAEAEHTLPQLELMDSGGTAGIARLSFCLITLGPGRGSSRW
jgi:hypothetical protein